MTFITGPVAASTYAPLQAKAGVSVAGKLQLPISSWFEQVWVAPTAAVGRKGKSWEPSFVQRERWRQIVEEAEKERGKERRRGRTPELVDQSSPEMVTEMAEGRDERSGGKKKKEKGEENSKGTCSLPIWGFFIFFFLIVKSHFCPSLNKGDFPVYPSKSTRLHILPFLKKFRPQNWSIAFVLTKQTRVLPSLKSPQVSWQILSLCQTNHIKL